MDRRAIFHAGMAAGAATLLGVAGMAGAAVGQEPGRWRYRRRRGRHGAGLLVKDIEGTATWGRRAGAFEGDLLLQALHLGRKLHASGAVDGEADLEGRRFDFELNIEERFRRVGLDLDVRRDQVAADLAEIEFSRRLELDLDSFKLDDIRGPRGNALEDLFKALAEALADDEGWRSGKRREDDAEDLVRQINRLLDHYRHEVGAGWRRRHAA